MSLVVKKNTIVVFLMLIACLFLRPAALGEKFNTIAVGVLFVAAVIQYLYTRYIDRYAMKICVYIWIYIIRQLHNANYVVFSVASARSYENKRE